MDRPAAVGGLPWGLRIDPDHRPDGYAQFATFHPTCLYEALWNLALAGALGLYERRRPDARPGTLFALYVGGYGLGRAEQVTGVDAGPEAWVANWLRERVRF